MRRKSHVRCEAGENLEITSNSYLSLFPDNIKNYDLIIHCGGCMINRKTILNRINFCENEGVAITNYGIVLAFLNKILDRSLEIFNNN